MQGEERKQEERRGEEIRDVEIGGVSDRGQRAVLHHRSGAQYSSIMPVRTEIHKIELLSLLPASL